MNKLKLGLIGCGGRMHAHMSTIDQSDDVEVVSVADPVEERRQEVSVHYQCKAYRDHNELFDHAREDGLEAVIIAIEPTAHINCEERAIDLDLPFLVEKPMTLDLKQANEIARRVEEKGLITSVGFQDRYLDVVNWMKDELPRHPQGGLVYGAWVGGIPGVWWWAKKSTCGGQLVEQNIHLLDGLRYLFGEPLSVYATASRGIVVPGKTAPKEYDTDDHSTAVIRFPGSVTATLVSGCYSTTVRPNCGLVLTLADMVMDYRLRSSLIIRTEKETREVLAAKNQTALLDRAFFEAVVHHDPSPVRSPYADAVKSLALGFAANESMETGNVIYFKEKE